MPVDFTDPDVQDMLDEGEDAAEEVAATPEFEGSFAEDQMSEAEARLETARYYKLLLDAPLFNDPTPAAAAVELEMRTFARQRLAVLLGVPTRTTGLSDAEAARLRVLADETVITAIMEIVARVLKKPSLVSGARKQLQDAPVGAQMVTVAPTVAPRQIREPSLRQVAVPVSKAPPASAAAPRPTPAPAAAPGPKLAKGTTIVNSPGGGPRKQKKKVKVRTVTEDGEEIEEIVVSERMIQARNPKGVRGGPGPTTDPTGFSMISARLDSAAQKDFERRVQTGADIQTGMT